MMKIIALWFWIGFFAVVPSAAKACQCAAIPSPRETYHASSLVFFGKVTSMSVKDKTNRNYMGAEVKVTVEKIWKGKPSKFIILRDIGGDCPAFGFVQGKRYVFYTEQPQKGKILTVYACSWIRKEANAKADLKWLGTIKRRG